MDTNHLAVIAMFSALVLTAIIQFQNLSALAAPIKEHSAPDVSVFLNESEGFASTQAAISLLGADSSVKGFHSIKDSLPSEALKPRGGVEVLDESKKLQQHRLLKTRMIKTLAPEVASANYLKKAMAQKNTARLAPLQSTVELMELEQQDLSLLTKPMALRHARSAKGFALGFPVGPKFSGVRRSLISSYYGWRHGRPHKGIDIAAPIGTTIRASEDGFVEMAEPYYGYGNLIVINHGNGVKTRYAHLGKMFTRVGVKVYKGQMLGTIGMTGSTTGPHLHFEVLKDNRHQNPMTFLKS